MKVVGPKINWNSDLSLDSDTKVVVDIVVGVAVVGVVEGIETLELQEEVLEWE